MLLEIPWLPLRVNTEPDARGGTFVYRPWSGLQAGEAIRRPSLVLRPPAHGPGRGDTLGVVHNVRVRRQAVAEEHSLGPLGAHVAIWIVHGALGRELVEHPARRNSGCYT